MKTERKLLNTISILGLASLAAATMTHAQSADALLNKLVQKGVLTQQEANELASEATQSNKVSSSKWKISDTIKSIQFFGDVRFRYEYRAAENAPGSGVSGNTYERERFRYAVRVGIRGDVLDNFYYGLRVETGSNPRSPWITFGDDTNPTPWAKNSDGIYIGQVYVGWRPTDWFDITVGKMPMPLYVTPMVFDADLNPEDVAEKFITSVGNVDLFANFGQFIYQDVNPDHAFPTSDTFVLAWQLGANFNLTKDMSFKIAPAIYNYTGGGQTAGLNKPFSGQGLNGLNVNTNGYNQNGINDLLILEMPAELNFNVGNFHGRLFGDFAYNFDGNNRAEAAVAATAPGGHLPTAITGQNKAYQVGFGVGPSGPVYGPTAGLVYGSYSKRNAWEARVYWQHVEQYALDVNLLDSDFFEGRANLQGIYAALAYGITSSIIGTVRYGYAQPINNSLGTGGNNPDLAILNPVKYYNLFQVDLTWRF